MRMERGQYRTFYRNIARTLERHANYWHVPMGHFRPSGPVSPAGSCLLRPESGPWANIPPRSDRNEPICFSRANNLVERFFNKIRQCRWVATRYNKLAANYLAFVQLASIRLRLRIDESAP
jgi:hypothetical protein